MKCYRMKHIPTGLYYCRSRKVRYKLGKNPACERVKSNLSKEGKIYTKKPTFAWIGGNFYSHLHEISDDQYGRVHKNPLVKFVESEWEIEEV